MIDALKTKLTKETLLMILYVLVIGGGLISVSSGETAPVFSLWNNKKVIMIDAGHGGWDPGKLGIGGALEKDINLSVADRLRSLLELSGSFVVTTRSEDVSLGDTKAQDLRTRAQMAAELGAEMFISIHQNSYPDSGVTGAQAFYYGKSEDGERLAKLIQEELRLMNPDNRREAMPNMDYYVLKNTIIPAVLVECGFLSNPEEAGRLTEEEYQLQIAWAIYSAIVRYYER